MTERARLVALLVTCAVVGTAWGFLGVVLLGLPVPATLAVGLVLGLGAFALWTRPTPPGARPGRPRSE